MDKEELNIFNVGVSLRAKEAINRYAILDKRQASGASDPVSDARAALKDFMRVKKVGDETSLDDEFVILDDNLDETSLDDEFVILVWWKLKASKYPILSRLTRDILIVFISTVASESTFSTSGRTLNPVRSSLNDENIEALVCARDQSGAAIMENDLKFGDPLWPSDEMTLDDSDCAGGNSVVC